MNFVMQTAGTLPPKTANEWYLKMHKNFKTICGAIYGELDDVAFVVAPRYDSFANKFEVSRFSVHVENEFVSKLASFIRKNGISLQPWRVPGKTVSAAKARENRKFAKMQSNADATFRYRKGNPVRHSVPGMNSDYAYQGRKKYGKHIEMNGKRVYMGKSIVQYMDGPGTGLRPLDTQCFIGTGRKVRFAKAPQ